MKARRFETLHDTTPWKVVKPTDEGRSDSPDAKTARRVLQIDVQRWVRSTLRGYRENAPVETPCNYGHAERIVHRILSCLGRPLWHDDQLHLSEWQALQLSDALLDKVGYMAGSKSQQCATKNHTMMDIV